MRLSIVRLGRIIANTIWYLLKDGYKSIAFNRNFHKVKLQAREAAPGKPSLDEIINHQTKPLTTWVIVPSGKPTVQMVKNDMCRYLDAEISSNLGGWQGGYCLRSSGGCPEATKGGLVQ